MRILKIVMILLVVVFLVIQFFHPEKNVTDQPQPNDIAHYYNTPANVKLILAKACNDCHTNNTNYPWYSRIQPTARWLAAHIKDGKHDLNFNDFATYRARKQYRKMEEVEELVKEGTMPLDSYTWVHSDAKLTSTEKDAIISWASSVRNTLKARFPADSLIKKN